LGGVNTPLVLKKKPKGSERVSLVISTPKGVIKRAVRRNLLKRRIRSIMRSFLKDADYVVLVREDVSVLPFNALKELLEKEIKRN